MGAAENRSVGLRWTGHILVDTGIAGLTTFSERARPEDVTADDLERFARYAEEAFFAPFLQSYSSVLFTMNAPMTQPSWELDRRRAETGRLLRSHTLPPDTAEGDCAFCGRAAVHRVYRDMVPMLTGRGVPNFFGGGSSGLPACGLCTVALLALVVSAPMCSGRALIIEPEDRQLLLGLVREWMPKLRERVQLSHQTHKKPPTISHALTRTVEALVYLQDGGMYSDEVRGGVTVYHLSNSGQGPAIDIYRLPSSVVRFVWRARKGAYRAAWDELVHRGWLMARQRFGRPKDTRVNKSDPAADGATRNQLYEDLFALPEQAVAFVRRHFLPRSLSLARGGRSAEGNDAFAGLQSDWRATWGLLTVFTEEVMGMDKTRISAIAQLGDKLAEEIAAMDDARLFGSVFRADDYRSVRNILIRLSASRLRRGLGPLVSFDDFLTVFEEGEELARADWRLAWDLTVIRMLEGLHQTGWLGRQQTALKETETGETA